MIIRSDSVSNIQAREASCNHTAASRGAPTFQLYAKNRYAQEFFSGCNTILLIVRLVWMSDLLLSKKRCEKLKKPLAGGNGMK